VDLGLTAPRRDVGERPEPGRTGAGRLAVRHGELPGDGHGPEPRGRPREPVPALGEVVASFEVARLELVEGEDGQVAAPSTRHDAPVGEPEEVGRALSEAVDR